MRLKNLLETVLFTAWIYIIVHTYNMKYVKHYLWQPFSNCHNIKSSFYVCVYIYIEVYANVFCGCNFCFLFDSLNLYKGHMLSLATHQCWEHVTGAYLTIKIHQTNKRNQTKKAIIIKISWNLLYLTHNIQIFLFYFFVLLKNRFLYSLLTSNCLRNCSFTFCTIFCLLF